MKQQDYWEGLRIALISAHPDDVAYSIGGLLSHLAPTCTLDLITVFSRSVWATSALLRQSGPEAVTALRREEDLTFCRRLGMRLHTLDFCDSSLAGYESDTELTDDHRDDLRAEPVEQALCRLLATLGPDVVLAPAAIGNHIDHRIVHAALRSFAAKADAQVAFYEDLPYGAELELAELEALLEKGGLRPLALINIDQTLEAKVGAAWDYPSQTDQETVDAILTHARRLAESAEPDMRHAERIWELT